MSILSRTLPLVFALGLATNVRAIAPATAAQETVNVDVLPVEAQVQASVVDKDGRFRLFCSFYPDAKLEHDYRLVVGFDVGAGETVFETHELKPSPREWVVAKRQSIELDLRVPDLVPAFSKDDPDYIPASHDILAISFAFARSGSKERWPLIGNRVAADGSIEVIEVPLPAYFRTAGAAELADVFAKANATKTAGDPATAWEMLDQGLRDATRDETKEKFRDALRKIGRYDARPLSGVEQAIVGFRIRAEQVRYWRIVAGRMFDANELHGALRILEKIGGSLSQDADEAVIGAIDQVDRIQQDLDDLRQRITRELDKDEEALLAELVDKHGLTAKLFSEAQRRFDKGEQRLAIGLLRELRQSDDARVEAQARERWPEMEEAFLAATPPEQEKRVKEALEHPVWARTEAIASHEFIYIGPRDLLRGIPDDSKLNFDMASIFITDLFGRVPNPGGDRVTVYFKELFEFGGGIGGGKIIDIGNAEAKPARPVRVDTGLLYHEFTHCVDDTQPVYGGFHEGLANLGAAYAFEALDQDNDALHSFDRNLEEFRKYFLERDLEYWLIQNYGPSAGFFLHFVETYAKLGSAQHDWSGLRRFFREYRAADLRDGREPFVARGLAHFFVRSFGPKAFDDLVSFGFPLEERDRRVIAHEFEAFYREVFEDFDAAFTLYPTSPLPRDLVGRHLAEAKNGDDEDTRELLRKHGVITQWQTIGPFFTHRADAAACCFPPENKIDFDEKVPALRSTKDGQTNLIWREPAKDWISGFGDKPVVINASGWIEFDYKPYGQRNAAIYAVTNVTLAHEAFVLVHVRADDDFALFVDGRRYGTYEDRGKNGSSSNGKWRGPFKNLPDAQRFALPLAAGRHTLVVKIKNSHGPAGLTVALSRPDGSTLDFEQDIEPVVTREPASKTDWKRVVLLDHRSFKSKMKTTVGGFKAAGKAVAGMNTEGEVEWRRFTVRPGFPKDSPSNLAWLRPELSEKVDDLRMELVLETDRRAPKMILTFQGEGNRDGLSGWNLILDPRGDNQVVARLERYDRLVYETEPIDIASGSGTHTLQLEYLDLHVSVTFDELVLFDAVPVIPIHNSKGIGLATWGAEPRIQSFELFRSR